MTKVNHAVVGAGTALLLGLDPFLSLFASLLPDGDITIARLTGAWNGTKRSLLTSHRGITHHAILIPTFALFSIIATHFAPYPLPYFIVSFSAGYVSHIVCDALTPLGIPYKLSYYPRFAISLFGTGSILEHILVGIFVLCTCVYVVLNPDSLLAPVVHYLFLAELVFKTAL